MDRDPQGMLKYKRTVVGPSRPSSFRLLVYGNSSKAATSFNSFHVFGSNLATCMGPS